MLRYLRNRHIDGALVVSHHKADSLADHLAALALPCAFVGRPWTSADKVAYVDTDNVAGRGWPPRCWSSAAAAGSAPSPGPPT